MTIASKAKAYEWREVDRGLFYTYTDNIHAFKVDPGLFQLSVFTAKDLNETDATASMLAKKSGAILAVNGGFFSPSHKSLGLLMREGKVLNPTHKTKWWAVFFMKDRKPHIVPPDAFIFQPRIEAALQAGPRLVVDGKMPKLKEAVARRSGIGIRKNGDIVIAVTDETPKTMEEFAGVFQRSEEKEGFDCVNALNLDGGRSSQIYFNDSGFKLEVPGLSRIANAITVFPR
ncbi:MAG: phosphodiester glycosidase family protein [Deltaproteobacteria bacterium]|nr:phosphodiester glycosidase family protein [Deltaproteobacteria bacterium]MDZ4224917.1 phosphodiester glycosidase family protein [bacterium]